MRCKVQNKRKRAALATQRELLHQEHGSIFGAEADTTELAARCPLVQRQESSPPRWQDRPSRTGAVSPKAVPGHLPPEQTRKRPAGGPGGPLPPGAAGQAPLLSPSRLSRPLSAR